MVESTFDVCWNCGTSKEGVVAESREKPVKPMACLRCSQELEHIGTKDFHEGTNWGVLGGLGELFVNRDRFDVYACPRCGRVEFFVDGVGEEHRPQ